MKNTKKKKDILFVGTANWPQRLSSLANKYCEQDVAARAVSLNLRAIPYFLYWLVKSETVVRVGVRPGIKKWKMFLFDCIWLVVKTLNRKAGFFYYWIGTDVLMACKSQSKENFFLRKSKSDVHLAGAPWFVDELRCIGIDSELCVFPLDMRFDKVAPKELPAATVLTYIPDLRSDFYGGELILKLAEQYSKIDFNIVGGRGEWASSDAENVKFLGWLPSINSLLEKRPIIIRLVPHDAIGGTVREGLAYGCHVICTYNIPHCLQVNFGSIEELYSAFERALVLRQNKETALNYDGFFYAEENWNPEILTKCLINRVAREADV